MAKDERPQINFRAEADNIALLQQAARSRGLTLSAWLRMIALQAARRDVKKAA